MRSAGEVDLEVEQGPLGDDLRWLPVVGLGEMDDVAGADQLGGEVELAGRGGGEEDRPPGELDGQLDAGGRVQAGGVDLTYFKDEIQKTERF